ncbi:TIC20-II [Scenedesmus sp. PABB004]|nr:TIC20-II [Scenedesmus sp. PABB004]
MASALGMHARAAGLAAGAAAAPRRQQRLCGGAAAAPRVPAAPCGRPAAPARRRGVAVAARYRGGSPDAVERVLAAVPYLLPLLDSFGYGRFLFYQFPALTRVIAPLSPLVSLYASVPFAPLLAFFAVYLGIVQNQRWSRFVRFNGMQAMLLDILLILPRLAEQVVSPPGAGWGLQAYITAQNTVWIFVAACVAYGVASSLLGQAARIPLVADAAEQQVR